MLFNAKRRTRKAIIDAINVDDAELLEKLVRNKSIDKLTHDREPDFLETAISRGSTNCLRVLLENGADPNREWCFISGTTSSPARLKQPALMTTLHCDMSAEKRAEFARVLLAHGADANMSDGFSGKTVLQVAIEQRQYDCVNEMVPFSDLSKTDSSGHTPMHVAAYLCDVSAMKLLLEQNTDVVNQTTTPAPHETTLNTPLHLVSKSVPARDVFGRTVTLSDSPEEAARFLIEHGADVNSRNGHGKTPLMLLIEGAYDSIRAGNLKVHRALVNLFIGAGAEIDMDNHWLAVIGNLYKTESEESALIKTSYRQELLESLLGRIEDINTTHPDTGDTLLHTMCSEASELSIKELELVLKHASPDIDAKNKLGQTPLMVLLRSTRTIQDPPSLLDKAELLIAYGADATMEDNDGFTQEALLGVIQGSVHSRVQRMQQEHFSVSLP